MKLFISADIEGVAGIIDLEQCKGPGPEFEIGRRLLLGELNAAIEGARSGGVTEVVVNDAHSTMHNLPPAELAGKAAYVSGKRKPLYMMQGLDESFDCVFFVGYHGSIGAEHAALTHTYSPAMIYDVELNGVPVGESGVNALVAQHFGVPVVLITGDSATAREASRVIPGIECAVVKESYGRFAAKSLHPAVACELIQDAAERATRRSSEFQVAPLVVPAVLNVTFLISDMAELATRLEGVNRVDARRVAIEGSDLLEVHERFLLAHALTSTVAGL